MGLLKELWDMISVVESSMAAWRTTPWRDIHVEDMELECKRFSKDIRGLDKEVRDKGRRNFNIMLKGWFGGRLTKGRLKTSLPSPPIPNKYPNII